MRLRPRVALTTAGLMIPLAALFTWGDARIRERAASDVLVADAEALLEGDARAACERSPEAWVRSLQGLGPRLAPRRPPPPPWSPEPGAPDGPPELVPEDLSGPHSAPGFVPRVHLYPFDASLRPSVSRTAPLDPHLLAEARSGAADARRVAAGPGVANEEALLRTPWGTGPCAFVLAVRPSAARSPTAMDLARSSGPPLLAIVVAVLFALGPIVVRIRELATRVRASALHQYREPIAMTGGDEIEELAGAFDSAAREVRAHVDAQERREQTLRDFLANTAHDVMTPLTVLQGHLVALRDAEVGNRAASHGLLRAALDEAGYIGALVNNLGVAARLEAGEPHLVRVRLDLGQLVERCLGRHHPIARQHEVEIVSALPETTVTVEGDPTLLEQAIGNVLFNAIHHNRAGGRVAVVVSALPGGAFRVRVLDDGPRMTDEEIARLERAEEDPARSRRRDGHGLGLSITRKIAGLHRMTLRFARSDLGGLRVDIEGECAAITAA